MKILLFLLLTSVVLLIPLIPGFIEIIKRSDTAALKIWQHHSNQPKNFAITFAAKVKAALQEHSMFNELSLESYRVIENDITSLTKDDLNHMNLIKGSASLQNYSDALHELYVAGDLKCKGHNILRAALVENNLYLGRNTSVLRWAHAKNIFIKKHSRLNGRITADREIHFDGDGQFIYLHADKISFGVVNQLDQCKAESMSLAELADQHNVVYDGTSSRLIIRGDCVIPNNRNVTGELIVYGKLRVKDGAHVNGNIKAHGSINLFSNCHINGAVTCNTDIHVHNAVFIKGPVIAEKRLSIKANSIIGTPTNKTSVTAHAIKIKNCGVIHGTLRAKKLAIFKA